MSGSAIVLYKGSAPVAGHEDMIFFGILIFAAVLVILALRIKP